MPPKHFIRLTALLVTIVTSSARAQLTATMPSPSDFQNLLHDLDSESPETRDQAEANIMVYPLSLPELTEAAAQPGLSPEVAKRVQHCIDLLGPGYDSRLRKRKEEDFVQNNRHQHGVAAYQSFGDHNPKWDDDAIAAIQLATETPSDQDRQNAPKIVDLCAKAIAAGCNDPIIKYFHARFEYKLPDAVSHANQIVPEFRAAAIAMLQSKYSARLRTNAVIDALSAQENLIAYKSVLNSDEDRKLLDQCLALLPDIVQQEVIPWRIHESVSLLQYHYTAVLGDDKKAFDTIFPVLSKAMPNSAEPLYYKGYFYVNYAWDARGNGWANTVTEQGWKLFGERLTVAREALTQAYTLDPNDARAATEMITVCMGQSSPENEMATWFDRAINADPDSQSACESKLMFLEPKWGGSQDACLAFARACLATEDWSATIPQVVIDAHLELAVESDNADEYFKDPTVWDDIQKCYAGELAIWPDDVSVRSWYTYLACRCGQFAIANAQFKILGDRAVTSPFGTTKDLETWRQKAAQEIPDTQKSN